MSTTCTNGRCARPTYRGTECYRCWLGTKWDSMKQRTENRQGRYCGWEGLPLEFSRREFVAWGIANPPHPSIERPSIDRIKPEQGYTPSNIRWIDSRKNSAGPQRDIKDGFKLFAGCGQILPTDHFGPYHGKPYGQQTQSRCRPCKRRYQYEWSKRKTANG